MFHRIQYAEWQQILPILAFCISFLLFLLIVVRAIRMRKDKASEMANLPLSAEKEKSDSSDNERKPE
ncbi:hypothetical protein [Puniceicoccus vermicola]|uniref:Cbb3-type cytochrome c oxidase subunit 3 n=1 Tax=Puniceicoccus vermicola TaxID=388746 RepID=A0A7X1AXZ7_9BACT|nr:hypothetical protein [Puniceicoccus vermicola]MBC2602022.1 hypothetical protein [Puniceicoccus vermicola]